MATNYVNIAAELIKELLMSYTKHCYYDLANHYFTENIINSKPQGINERTTREFKC